MTPGEYVWSLNGNRRHLTTSQRAACYVDLVGPKERPKAKERQAAAGPAEGKGKKTGCGKLPQAVHPAKTRDVVGESVGMSGKTYAQVPSVVISVVLPSS